MVNNHLTRAIVLAKELYSRTGYSAAREIVVELDAAEREINLSLEAALNSREADEASSD